MSPENKKTVLVTDFDGTIIKKDFFYHIIDKYMSEEDIQPWNDYLAKKITHFDALNAIFQKLHLSLDELHKTILEIPVEDCFTELVDFCNDNSVDIYVVSAGADYYINYILETMGIKDSVKLIANESTYATEQGLNMTKLSGDSLFYSDNYGIDKEAVIKYLKTKYDLTIFAGDGNPDFKAARLADVVFARGTLKELCERNNVEFIELDSYCRIYDFIKTL